MKILDIPGVPSAFQLPEIVFLLLLALALTQPKLWLIISTYKLDLLDYSVLGLLFSQLFAAAFSNDAFGQTAPYIILYLTSVYFLVKLLLRRANFSTSWVKKSIGILGILLVGSVLFSWVYAFGFPSGNLVLTESKYLPALGWKQRVLAFTMSPNMLLNLLLLPLLISIAYFIQKRKLPGILGAGVLLLAAAGTWSKSLVLVGVGTLIIGIVLISFPKGVRALSVAVACLAVLFMIISTKFIVLTENQADHSVVLNQSYATTNLITRIGDKEVYESMHYRLNKEAVIAFCAAPVLGIGPGQFIDYLEKRKLEGCYPNNKRAYAPHSLYLGVLAQSGLLGFSGLLFFLWALGQKWRSLWQQVATEERWLALGLGVYLLLWALDGLSMDTLHFRHFWWVVIAISAWEQQLRARKAEIRSGKVLSDMD